MAGEVISSQDARFKPGDAVIATSFDIGVSHHGGYAELARVPAKWVVPLPAGLSLFDSMAMGTARVMLTSSIDHAKVRPLEAG